MLLLDTEGNHITLKQLVFRHRVLKVVEDINPREWDATAKRWKFPQSEAANLVARLSGFELQQSAAFRSLLRDAVTEHAAAVVPTIDDYTFKTKPFAHQVTAFHLARKADAFALLMEMGTGKTKTMIDTLSWLIQNQLIEAALILVPKAVLFSWEREIEQHSPLPKQARRTLVVTGNGRKKEQAFAVAAACQFVITNYETPLTFLDTMLRLMKGRKWAVVADESTRIKNPASRTFKSARALGAASVRRYIMTGSPITQSPLDAYAQFCFLDQNILGHQSFTSFRAEYATAFKLPNSQVRIWKSFKNLDRLAKAIKPHSIRVLKVDCLDLPEKVYKTIELDMGPVQAEFYRQMRDEAVVTPDPLQPALAAPVILTKLMRLQQIASGFLPIFDEFGKEKGTRDIEDAPKVDACIEVVTEALESGQSVIVWCRFIWEVLTLERELSKVGKVVTYYGATTAVNRQAAVDAIQTGTANVFIGQIQTGGMGITLTKASTMVYYSNTFSLSERLQSEDRAHRIGQTRNVLYVDLVAKGTVDHIVLKAHREKKDLADIVTGDSLARILGGHF